MENGPAPSGLTEQGRKVTDHWSNLAVTFEGAKNALEKAGVNLDAVTADDLHPLDMIHMGGLSATDEIAELANIQRGNRVLDVGCGVGGPARRFANKFGANVTGVELSPKLSIYSSPVSSLVATGFDRFATWPGGADDRERGAETDAGTDQPRIH